MCPCGATFRTCGQLFRPKEKVQKDKHRSTKHIYKTKDRATRTPLSNDLQSTTQKTIKIDQHELY
jgi:hypothetical protein